MSLNEKCDEVFSPSDLNGLAKLVSSLDGAADIPSLYSTDDVGDGKAKPHRQNNSQLTEQNVNLAYMNTSNDNAALNSSFQAHSKGPQIRYRLDGLPLDSSTTDVRNASEAKGQKIVNYSFTSSITKSVDQYKRIDSKSELINMNNQNDVKKFTSASPEKNGTQNFQYISDASKEEYIATPDVLDQEALLKPCKAKLFEDIYKGSFLPSSNISVSKDSSGHFGFIYGQSSDENCEERQNQISFEVESEACDKMENEPTNNFEPFLLENDVPHIARPSGMTAESHRQPQVKRFICPFCGKGFNSKYHFNIHNRYRTGEKPYVCDKCGKGFVTNLYLTSHLAVHREEKPFACDRCETRFKFKYSLTKHFRSHTRERPYKCFMCAKTYMYSESLRRHQRNIHEVQLARKVNNLACKEIVKS